MWAASLPCRAPFPGAVLLCCLQATGLLVWAPGPGIPVSGDRSVSRKAWAPLYLHRPCQQRFSKCVSSKALLFSQTLLKTLIGAEAFS